MKYLELEVSENGETYIIDQERKKRIAFYKKCEFCGADFIVEKRATQKGKGRFCSPKCSNSFREKRVIIECALCGKSFERKIRYLKNAKKSGFQFCSRKCKGIAQSTRGPDKFKEMRPDHYKEGYCVYRKIALSELEPKCSVCGYDEYESVLEVHHIDKNRKNAVISNLVILCPTHHAMITRGIAIISKDKTFEIIIPSK